MASFVLITVLALAGQLSQLNDRYSEVGGQSTESPANNPPVDDESDVVSLLGTPPVEAASPSSAGQPSATAADPYGRDAPPVIGNLQSSSLEDAGSSLPASPPPAYDSLPARSGSTTVPGQTGSAMPGPKPSVLMRAMLTPPAGSRLSGQQVALADVVAAGQTRAEQGLHVEAYWDLCSSMADYYLGLREQQELQQLRTLVPQPGAAFQQAENELSVRAGTSQRAARASQYRLASLMGRGPDTLPLPGDLPHCGNYKPHYEQIFGERPSFEAQELSALLPLRYAELKDAAAAVTRAEDFMRAVVNNRNENSDGTGSVRALELVALRRRAFVQIARDYNRRIARYVELATPGEIGPDRLIGRLILQADSSTATRTTGAALPPNRQSRNGAATRPSTFAEKWVPAGGREASSTTLDNAVTPASGESTERRYEERSLLVNPR